MNPDVPDAPTARHRNRWLVVGVVVTLAAVGVGVALAARYVASSRSANHAAAYVEPVGPLPAAPADPLSRGTGVLFGAWVQPSGSLSGADQESSITSFERLIERKLAIDNLYVGWREPMPVSLARWDLRGGRVPMISWAAVSSKAVVDGTYEGTIRAAAAELRSLHGPILLRYFAEMNNGYASAGSPATYIAAWRHVHQLFQAAGATNVQWVWCPTSQGFLTGTTQQFYPGDSYVDWIGADGYNWAPKLPHSSWRSLATIFSPFYQWAAHQSRPLLIGEFGSGEGSPGAKASWFRQAAQQLRAEFPRIRAVVYFNSRHENFGFQFDWRVNTSKSALIAFRTFVNETYFKAHPST
jgi:hypothetical protein